MPPSDQNIRAWIAGCGDRAKLASFADNADKQGRLDLRDEALKRIWTIEGLDYSDPLHRDFHEMLAAYEYFLQKKHGKKIRAAYTWRKLANKGVEKTLEDWAVSPKSTEGFTRLVEAGLARYTGECVVVRHADRFPAAVVVAAKKRLEVFGVQNGECLKK
jgi:hypothetical protein